ncbi:pentapeptide repeat-containing protein [Chryseobacterium gregarium]
MITADLRDVILLNANLSKSIALHCDFSHSNFKEPI